MAHRSKLEMAYLHVVALTFGALALAGCGTPMLVAKGDEASIQKNYALALVNYDAAATDKTLSNGARENIHRQRDDALRAWIAEEVKAQALAHVEAGNIDKAVGLLVACSNELETRHWIDSGRLELQAVASAVGDRLAVLFDRPMTFAERTRAIAWLGYIDRFLPSMHRAHEMLARLRLEAAEEHLRLAEESAAFATTKYLHRRLAHHHRSDVVVDETTEKAFLAVSQLRPVLSKNARICPSAKQAIARFDKGSGLLIVIKGKLDCEFEAHTETRWEKETIEVQEKDSCKTTQIFDTDITNCSYRSVPATKQFKVSYGVANGRLTGLLTLDLANIAPRSIQFNNAVEVDEAKLWRDAALEAAKERANQIVSGALDDSLRLLAKQLADDFLAKGTAAEQQGDWVGAEAAYATSIALLGAAPGRLGAWFEDRYGLSEQEIVSALTPSFPSLSDRSLAGSIKLPSPDAKGLDLLWKRNVRADKGRSGRTQLGLEGLFLSPRRDQKTPSAAIALAGVGVHATTNKKSILGVGVLTSLSIGYSTQENTLFAGELAVGPNVRLGPVVVTVGIGGGGSVMTKGQDGSYAQPNAWYWESGLITRIVLDRAWELEVSGMRTEDATLKEAPGRIFNVGESVRESRVGAGLLFRSEGGNRYYFGGRLIDLGEARAIGAVVGFEYL